MYEIWYIERDDWGKTQYVKRKGFKQKLSTAVKLANKYGKNAFVKRYTEVKPIYIVGAIQGEVA